MLAIQARSFNNYFYLDSENKNHPARYMNNKVVGILFENKVDYASESIPPSYIILSSFSIFFCLFIYLLLPPSVPTIFLSLSLSICQNTHTHTHMPQKRTNQSHKNNNQPISATPSP